MVKVAPLSGHDFRHTLLKEAAMDGEAGRKSRTKLLTRYG